MKKNIFLLVFIISNSLFAQNWQQVTSFPFAGVHHPITFSYENYGFSISGSNTDLVYRYDSNTDSWTQLSNFPGGDRGYAYGVQVGSKAYMGFGSNLSGNFPTDWWEYDIINDSWSQKSSFPGNGRNHPAMVSVGGKIFVGCGSNTANLGDWWEYDINSDSWSQKPDIPGNDRHHPYYFGIGNYAYVGFGHGSVPGPGSNQSGSFIYNDFYRYDPSNDSWLQLDNFPSEARVAGTQFSFNGKGYVLSGDGDDHSSLDSGELWEYEPSTDLWTQLPSHPGDAIWAPGCFVIDCSVYFLLGQNNNTFPTVYPSNIYTYKLSDDCGCTDPLAVNFSSIALIDDGSCCYISGCTNPYAINFDSTACFDDNSCVLPVLGCTNQSASNYNANANTTIAYGGELDNTFSSGGYFNGDQHLIFDANQEAVIKSAVFYAESNTTVTFELRDNNGVVLDDTTHSLIAGIQRLILNFDVPIANDLQLGISAANSNLYRNNSGATYPYNIGNLINIKQSSASTNPLSYYYFYYNIEVETPCQNVTSIFDNTKYKRLVKIVDVLGKEILHESYKIQFYIYDDGSIEKKLNIKK
tara:strand:- start:13193 stop:14932 length:1740 start_codon:yes stop_codon:yes gene_type:complete